MRAAALAALALAGCASTQVAMFDGEGDAPVGAVAVLDPKSGGDAALLDRAGSRTAVKGARFSSRTITAEQSNQRYAPLLATMPERPTRFVLYFEEATTQLIPRSRAILPDLFAEVKRRPGVDIEIIGHTDTVGGNADNDALSRRRAMAVGGMLTELGLDRDLITVSGRGERDLRVETGDETDELRNRRVEVYVR